MTVLALYFPLYSLDRHQFGVEDGLGENWIKLESGNWIEFLTVCLACKAIIWPKPGYKENVWELWVLRVGWGGWGGASFRRYPTTWRDSWVCSGFIDNVDDKAIMTLNKKHGSYRFFFFFLSPNNNNTQAVRILLVLEEKKLSMSRLPFTHFDLADFIYLWF